MEFSRANMQQAANDMASMSPDDLRSQAAEMRRNPDGVRRSVPAMAGLTDAQICAAADNLAAMADDTALRQATIRQVGGFEERDVAALKAKLPPAHVAVGARVEITGLVSAAQHNGKVGVVTAVKDRVSVLVDGEARPLAVKPENLKALAPGEGGKKTTVDLGKHAATLRSMDAEKMVAQAKAMRAMPKAQLRKSSAFFAHMSDAQLDEALAQLEQMAHNPQMRAAAASQIDNLSRVNPETVDHELKKAAAMNNNSNNNNMPAATNYLRPAAAAGSRLTEDKDDGERAETTDVAQEAAAAPTEAPKAAAAASKKPQGDEAAASKRATALEFEDELGNPLVPIFICTALFIAVVVCIGFAAGALKERRMRQQYDFFAAQGGHEVNDAADATADASSDL